MHGCYLTVQGNITLLVNGNPRFLTSKLNSVYSQLRHRGKKKEDCEIACVTKSRVVPTKKLTEHR